MKKVEIPSDGNETVYVTRRPSVFHARPDCSKLLSGNLRRPSKKKFESQRVRGIEPCLYCYKVKVEGDSGRGTWVSGSRAIRMETVAVEEGGVRGCQTTESKDVGG